MTQEDVREALRAVMDPEIGMNVVDLGLVYGIDIEAARVAVRLTMTSPACPMAGYVVDSAKTVLRERFPACDVQVALVWEPPWEPSMMTESVRRQLGW